MRHKAKGKASDEKENARWHKASKALRRQKDKERDVRLAKGFGSFLKDDSPRKAKAGKALRAEIVVKGAKTKDGKLQAGKHHVKITEVHVIKTKPSKPNAPFRVLLEPTVIVPEEGAAIIADAGSIVHRVEQAKFYRDRVSPITRRADEVLVQYGTPKKVQYGWLRAAPNWKDTTGPTFLVQTRDDSAVSGWDRMRYLVSTSRKAGWLGDWLTLNATDEQRPLLRSVIRHFGGKPLKSQTNEDRIALIGNLALNTEIDMAGIKKAAKKGAKKSTKQSREREELKQIEQELNTKKGKAKKADKKAKVEKKAKVKKGAAGKAKRISRAEIDGMVIRRLVQENPFRDGTYKSKQWKLIKKGMTVAELVEKGGARGDVNWYCKRGWAKLVRPKATSE